MSWLRSSCELMQIVDWAYKDMGTDWSGLTVVGVSSQPVITYNLT